MKTTSLSGLEKSSNTGILEDAYKDMHIITYAQLGVLEFV